MKYFFIVSRPRLLSGFLALLLLVSSLAVSFTTSVNAASSLDNVVSRVSTLHIGGQNGCAQTDITQSWFDQSFWDTNWNSSYYGSNYANSIDTFHAAIQSNFSTGKGWAVQQRSNAGIDGFEVYLFDPDTTFTLTSTGFAANNHSVTALFFDLNANSACRLQMQDNGDANNAVLSTSATGSQVLPENLYIFATDPQNITYPDGYSGVRPYYSTSDIVTIPETYPKVTYALSSMDISASYKGDFTNGTITGNAVVPLTPPQIPFKIQYTLFDNSNNSVDSQTLSPTSVYKYNIKSRGHYDLRIHYIYAGVPYAQLPSTYTYNDTAEQLYVNGSNNYTSSTEQDTCSYVGTGTSKTWYCDEVSPYASCSITADASTWGTGLICYINTWFIQVIYALFIPDPSFITAWYNNLSSWFINKFGFLATSFGYISEISTNLISNASTGTCVISPQGTFFGKPFNLNLCEFGDLFPVAWNIIINLVRVLTVIAILFGLYKTYNSFISEGKE